jgi:membrane-bound inhibitor of C-type lysozyme
MKTHIITFIVAATILILAISFYKPGLHITRVSDVTTTCFLQTIETDFGKEYTFIQTDLSADGMATGMFNILPAAKDALTGPFSGTWKRDSDTGISLDVMHAYAAEGTNQQEQRLFRIDDKNISIGWNGNYTQIIPKVNCSQVPDEVVHPIIKINTTQLPPVTFTCPRKEVFTIKFVGVDKVELTSPGKGGISLNHALSASGARYANADESIVAWNKGNTLQIIENGKVTHDNCVARQ